MKQNIYQRELIYFCHCSYSDEGGDVAARVRCYREKNMKRLYPCSGQMCVHRRDKTIARLREHGVKNRPCYSIRRKSVNNYISDPR